MLSARAGEEASIEGIDAGADDYLVKPFSARELIARVSGCIALAQSRQDAAQAIEAARVKSELLTNMSHELRTPLNGVVGMTNLLCETSLDSVQREYADLLAKSSDALNGVITDILDFSKIEAGDLELDATDFELRDVVEETTSMFAEQARAKGLQIGHRVDIALPIAVNGDRARLRQILLNLLSNAVKFTASGQVALNVRAGGGEIVRFEVLDTGIGIKEDRAAHLFDAFVQADPSMTRRYGGTGLGLAISRELAQQLGGEIGTVPNEGGGSVFWFTARLIAARMAEKPA
jgi:signal transduction histidine kinase